MVEIVELKKRHTNRLVPEKYEEAVKKLRKEHDKMVRGMFEFVDAGPGSWLEFTYRYFKDEPLMTIKLIHGEICDLPMGIVKHLNNTMKKVRKMGNLTEAGPVGKFSTFEKQSRVRFTPLEVL